MIGKPLADVLRHHGYVDGTADYLKVCEPGEWPEGHTAWVIPGDEGSCLHIGPTDDGAAFWAGFENCPAIIRRGTLAEMNAAVIATLHELATYADDE